MSVIIQGPVSGLSDADAAWLTAASARVADGDDVATRDTDGTAGNLAVLDASGNAVDAGIEPGYWMQRTAVDIGETVTIPAGYQMIVGSDFEISGTLIQNGDLIVVPHDALESSNNLSDLDSAATARTNLGLGTAALSATGDFDAAGAAETAQAAAVQRANHTGTQLLATISDAGTMASQSAADYILKDAAILSKSTGYQLAAGDEAKIIECDGTFTVTLPNGLDAGFQATIVNVGSGTITLAAATTLQSAGTQLATQYTAATVYHRGSNIWLAFGRLT